MAEIKTTRDLINHCNDTSCVDCGKECNNQCETFFKHYKTIPCNEDKPGHETNAWNENMLISDL